ncbi:MAG: 3-dehydroquinate synthase [Chloroflexota bacterium]|nr:3-dehydroquinate synthase [Chloroflexota bacterium]
MRNIFLIGLSGSGKSTIGRLLSERLGMPFVDTDALVERECGKRIPAIFVEDGEDFFRACESRVLAQVAQNKDGTIVATGGGIVLAAENRQLMAERGIRIFLSVDPDTALQRLNAQSEHVQKSGNVPEIRPLLAGKEPLATLQHLLTTRSKWYEEADIICSTSNKTPERIVQELVAMIICSGSVAASPPLVRHVNVGAGYDAIVDWGGLGRLAQHLAPLHLPPRLFVLTDSHVADLYAQPLLEHLTRAGYEPHLSIIPSGESSKSQKQLSAIYDWLIEQRAERREAIIALGGGMIGDMVGYAAATYLRGVPLIHLPTSLLAQVDASIGGKTGINHAKGKNLIGAFYHPRLVLADPATLLTLPVRERTEGWAEIVKYGIILDTKLFAQLEAHADSLRAFTALSIPLLCQIVARCIALKVEVIEEDEREQGRRAILNYGHTIAHALENVTGYGALLHGEAVSLGMVVAAALAQELGMFAASEAMRQNSLLQALGLPIEYFGAVQAEHLLDAIQLDKKVSGKRIHWVLPQHIGDVTIETVPENVVRRVVGTFFAEKRP